MTDKPTNRDLVKQEIRKLFDELIESMANDVLSESGETPIMISPIAFKLLSPGNIFDRVAAKSPKLKLTTKEVRK